MSYQNIEPEIYDFLACLQIMAGLPSTKAAFDAKAFNDSVDDAIDAYQSSIEDTMPYNNP